MLFLQLAVAFAVCELPERSASMALAVSASDMPDCHEADGDHGLCVAHCSSRDQTVAKAQFNLPDLAVHPATPIRVAREQVPDSVQPRETQLAAAGPPARILFQSFLL